MQTLVEDFLQYLRDECEQPSHTAKPECDLLLPHCDPAVTLTVAAA